MSICKKIASASVVFLVEGAIARPAGKRPLSHLSNLFRRLVNSLKVARFRQPWSFFSVSLPPSTPSTPSFLQPFRPVFSSPSLDLQRDRYSISYRIMSFPRVLYTSLVEKSGEGASFTKHGCLLEKLLPLIVSVMRIYQNFNRCFVLTRIFLCDS